MQGCTAAVAAVRSVCQHWSICHRRAAVALHHWSNASLTGKHGPAAFSRRAVLYVPGNDLRKIMKTQTLSVDCIVLDCEDGVAATKKVDARSTISSVLASVNLGQTEIGVRINAVSSGLAEDDVATVLANPHALPHTLVLPKAESEDEIAWLCNAIREHTRNVSLKAPMNVILMVESANSLLKLPSLCQSMLDHAQKMALQAQLSAVIFGSDDFCADIGATRTAQGTELLYARQKVVVVAKAFKIQAIDMVHIDYKDLDGLRKYSLEGAQMGFTGKQVIHPAQVPVVQEAFSPSEQKVRWAQQLVAAFEQFQQSGKGSFTFHDQMIDKPLLLQAQNIVRLADAIAQRQTRTS